jgi:site-specific recombinase
MKMFRRLRKLLRRRPSAAARTLTSVDLALQKLTQSFGDATTLNARTRRATLLFATIYQAANERRFVARLLRWIRLLEQDHALRACFQHSWDALLADLDSVALFAETGLPGQHALLPEVLRRAVQRVLPSAREETDSGRLLAGIFPSRREVERFLEQPQFVFDRLARIFWPDDNNASAARVRADLEQALCLLAARVAGRGASSAVRRRGSVRKVEESPFYQLVFVTESLIRAHHPRPHSSETLLWRETVAQCIAELDKIHLHMEDAGVSSALVYDLRSLEATLNRMQLLSIVYVQPEPSPTTEPAAELTFSSARDLIDTLLLGRLNDARMRSLIRENLNLLARKTVERTGHGGEHYIAHNRTEYWQMWGAGIGGGLLTVFTAAIKMKIIELHLPLAIEGFLVGTDYAVSFVLLQIFGFALATKQPSMTAAALAGIVRENRGITRWSKISDFAADIARTQLAAAFSNVLAVCAGAVLFEKLWVHLFKTHYLDVQSAKHVYTTLHPFTSGTALFAAFTGVILWMAAVIGGWFENFAVYHRIPEAIAQHPLGLRLGSSTMRRAADWLERNAASWSTSIVLGYLLGFSPVVARFFGIPLDVRHVTLSTGTLALSAARYGTSSFGHDWLYYAMAGIAITFVLNLGVSFSIASIVALRAYDVPRHEQMQILRFLILEVLHSPLTFIFPPKDPALSVVPATVTDIQSSDDISDTDTEAVPENHHPVAIPDNHHPAA